MFRLNCSRIRWLRGSCAAIEVGATRHTCNSRRDVVGNAHDVLEDDDSWFWQVLPFLHSNFILQDPDVAEVASGQDILLLACQEGAKLGSP